MSLYASSKCLFSLTHALFAYGFPFCRLSVAATKLAPLREDECNDKVENDALKVAMDGAKEYLKSRPAILEAVPTVEHQPAPRTTPGNSSDEEFELELEAPADNKWTRMSPATCN